MPDTYANPYGGETPLGAALKNLAGVVTKGPSDAQNILRAETALKIKRENENTIGLGGMLRQYGTDSFDRGAATDLAIRAGVSPDHLGGYERYNAANTYGATDARTTNAAVGAGQAYSSTAGGFREDQANTQYRADQTLNENRHQFDYKPTTIGTDKGPMIVPQKQAYGQPAVEDLGKVKGNVARVAVNSPGGLAAADPATSRFIGSDKAAGTPHNYVAGGTNYITNDGTTDATSGQPLPAGGYLANAQGPAKDVGLNTSVTTDLQKADINHQQFKGLLNFTRNLATKDDKNFGIPGMVKGMFQDGVIMAGSVANGLGFKDAATAVDNVRQKALQSGINPSLLSGVFDPTLPALHTAADLLVFSAAQTLAGQEGRNVSDKDVKLFKGIAGDPREWMTNKEKYMAKLDTMEQIADLRQGVVDQRLRGGTPAAPQAAPGAVSAPAPAPGAMSAPQAPQVDPLADARAAIARGADPMAVRERLQKNGINPAGL